MRVFLFSKTIPQLFLAWLRPFLMTGKKERWSWKIGALFANSLHNVAHKKWPRFYFLFRQRTLRQASQVHKLGLTTAALRKSMSFGHRLARSKFTWNSFLIFSSLSCCHFWWLCCYFRREGELWSAKRFDLSGKMKRPANQK